LVSGGKPKNPRAFAVIDFQGGRLSFRASGLDKKTDIFILLAPFWFKVSASV